MEMCENRLFFCVLFWRIAEPPDIVKAYTLYDNTLFV